MKNESARKRIYWLHQKISESNYPNAKRIAEKFNISHRQAQRDIDYLKTKLNAPMSYNYEYKGFYYTKNYSLPTHAIVTEDIASNDDISPNNCTLTDEPQQINANITSPQIAYHAQIKTISDFEKLNLNGCSIERISTNKYRCEFYDIENFTAAILSSENDIRIEKPDWLRNHILRYAQRIIRNNS